MDKYVYLSSLYDHYGKLLTQKQQDYFEDYYFNNLSLQEISENENVSRNAVFKQLKTIEEKLNNYEEKLKLYKKAQKLNGIIINIKDDKLKKQLEDLYLN